MAALPNRRGSTPLSANNYAGIMHRFYLPPNQCAQPEFPLTSREAHHALHVLRLRPADRVLVLNGIGAELHCEVLQAGHQQLHLKVIHRKELPPPPCRITLLQAVPRAKLIEDIIQKATELGTHRVVPLLTERTASRLNTADDAARKQSKWQQVAIEAIKQCGSPWLPQIDAPISVGAFLERNETFDLQLVGSLQPGALHPRALFQNFARNQKRSPASACVWIGPEGDFTPNELAAIQSAGAQPVTLGPRVLRTETAAVYCLSVLIYELAQNQ